MSGKNPIDFNGENVVSTTSLSFLDRLKTDVQSCIHFSAFINDWICFIPACNEDNLKSLDKFEFRCK